MVLPLIKVFSLVVRVFSKPLIAYTKQIHLKNNNQFSHPLIRTAFIRLGNKYARWETAINRKFMNLNTEYAFRELADSIALEKGIEFFYQILFYAIVIGLPVYEMYKSAKDSKQKSRLLGERIEDIEKQFESISQKIPRIEELLKEEEQRSKEVHHYCCQEDKTDEEKDPRLSELIMKPISLFLANKELHVFHVQSLT